ncbi:50S ribosomal protein L33 [Bacillus spizizenii]
MRVNITLLALNVDERNYISKKNKRNNPDRVEFKKYCPRDKKSTLHRETK